MDAHSGRRLDDNAIVDSAVLVAESDAAVGLASQLKWPDPLRSVRAV
jgi:hypothetical protein